MLRSMEIARQTRAVGSPERSITHWLFVLLVLFTAAFYKDFSYLNVPFGPVRVYVTELVLAGILIALAGEALRRAELQLVWSRSMTLAGLYLAWGLVCLFRGYASGLLSLREFATNYYCLIFLLLPQVCRTQRALHRVAISILLGNAIACGVVLLRAASGEGSVTSTGAVRLHGFVGVGASFLLYYNMARPVRTTLQYVFALAACVVALVMIVVVTQYRSAAIALAASMVAWLVLYSRGRASSSVGSPVRVAVGIGLVAGLALIAGDALGPTIQRLGTIRLDTADPNGLWRLYLWAWMLEQLGDSPLLGYGFGNNLPALLFRGTAYGLDPSIQVGAHNSYLFIAYKEGLIGIALLAVFGVYLLIRSVRWVLAFRGRRSTWVGAAAASSFVFVATFAAFNVVLEGPYMGIFFWCFAGIMECSFQLASSRGPAVSVGQG